MSEKEKQANNEANQEAVASLIKKIGKNVLKLSVPITAGGEEVSELPFDFNALTGWEYAKALDGDPDATNAFRLSSKQALCLFAAAVQKTGKGVDERDVLERMSAVDAVRAVKQAVVFFNASGRLEGRLI